MNTDRPVAMTKAELVYRVVKERILTGQAQPGDSLSLVQLAQELGMSEIPVREAVRRLESERLVEFIPHVGAKVMPLDPSEIEELLEVRIELEALATAKAAETITPEQLAVLWQLQEQMEAIGQTGDHTHYGRLNIEFHRTIYAMGPYRTVAAMIDDIQTRTQRTRLIWVMEPQRVEESIAEHRAILDAIGRHDAEAARRLTREHKRQAFSALLQHARNRVAAAAGATITTSEGRDAQ